MLIIKVGAYLNLDKVYWAIQRYMSLIKVYKINKIIDGKLNFITQGNAQFEIAGDLKKFSIHATSHIKSDTYIDCSGGVTIGSYFHTGKSLTILSSNHNWRSNITLPYDPINIFKSVEIGNAVWLGSNVMIVPGVKIGDGAVVAGGSVVVKDVAAGSVVGGNPAVEIAERDAFIFKKLMKEQSFY